MSAPTVSDRPKRGVHSPRDASISLRVSAPVLGLINAAAAATGKSRTEFMLESARQHAIDVLLDQRFFPLGSAQYEAFMRVLDAPPEPTESLKRLLASRSPWEA